MRRIARVELAAAITPERVQDVAGQALRVHAHHDVGAVAHVAQHERDVRLLVELVFERVHFEFAEVGGKLGFRDFLHHRLVVHAVLDQIGDRDHQQLVPLGELRQLGHAGHRAVVIHDFADDAGGIQPADPRQIDRRFGLPGANEHAPGLRAQRKHVPRPREVRWLRPRVDGGKDRIRAIARGNTGARRVFRFDRHAERRAQPRGVLIDHQRNLELVEPLAGHRHADEAAAVLRHEVDRFRRHLLGRERQVAFVLAIFVVARR